MLLPLPHWYKPFLIGNPFFEANQIQILAAAKDIAEKNGVMPATSDRARIFRFHVDVQSDFTWPLTSVSITAGVVTRYIPAIFKGRINIPDFWYEGLNRVVWIDHTFNPAELETIFGGRLSVAGAWNDTKTITEWDMQHAHLITAHGCSVDFHAFTSRFDMHFYAARKNNPYGLPEGANPYPFMDGPDRPFPIITCENLWHPEHNPDGYWQPNVVCRKMIDETWFYVKSRGIVVLWNMHCHAYTRGANPDPVIMASIMHHSFMRGMVTAEPFWFPKGMSWRTEFFGAHDAEYSIPNDPRAQPAVNILEIFEGFNKLQIPGFDLIVYDGQAWSHCLLRTVQQGVEQLEKVGRQDLISRMVVLIDATSIIIGFEEATLKAAAELVAKGVRLEATTTFDLEAEIVKLKA